LLARKPLGLILPMTFLNMLLVRRLGILSTMANSALENGRSQASLRSLVRAVQRGR
jgi:hypothetical protein